jgi:hypothetical protein
MGTSVVGRWQWRQRAGTGVNTRRRRITICKTTVVSREWMAMASALDGGGVTSNITTRRRRQLVHEAAVATSTRDGDGDLDTKRWRRSGCSTDAPAHIEVEGKEGDSRRRGKIVDDEVQSVIHTGERKNNHNPKNWLCIPYYE